MPENIRISCLFFISLLFIISLPPAPFSAEQDNGPSRLAVIGVNNETSSGEFNKLLIARGIANLVAQSLYDTGCYQPVEEKPEIRGRINDLVRRHLKRSPEIAGDINKIEEIKKDLNCQAVAWAVIRDLKKARKRSSFGPFSTAKTTITITVEIFLKENDKQIRSHTGQGKGVTRAQGVIFQVRDDQIAFDETTAGQAVQQAVKEAVGKLAAE
ncbi:MAG: hypothetical protein ACQES8_04775 [Thermodesulfobacteriota bacterium]